MYRINEGSIDLPNDWQDRSINVIGSNISGPGITMTITRDDIPWGMAFAEYVDDQARQAAQALKDFKVVERRELTVNGHEAVEVECRWVAKQGPIHQIITTVQSGQRALVLTASVGGKMSNSQMAEMRRITSTLKLDQAEA
ncbi:DUF1795 domain-containing protein [Paracoccus sp. 11-3]|uniref:DUF1795 domain-containing protein n=1 Tax=Paracoccus amoyensis TaxID=2760093 RepID=A0A926J624_9RHOB|nr:DUF1795 domain-containing protein [Paracoccus amoyensis]MBC9246832.1 DUF1795 domain-containing protein [Paracoccus amoyensis]